MYSKILLLSLSAICLLNPVLSLDRPPSSDNDRLLRELIHVNDGIIPVQMARQQTDKANKYYGALFDRDSVVSPIHTAQFIQTLMCGYVSGDSRYHRSGELLERMTLAAKALLSLQHEDGTIDLLTTNFHSTPDLGFTIFPVATAYSIMSQKKDMTYGEFPAVIRQYLLKAGDALSVGGIHTPNHRWVVSAALAWIHSFFPDDRYKARVQQWLAEKIDIDPDGQYNERSTAVYTPITNKCLLDIAKKLKLDYLYDVVRKNLDLTFYLVHANGEIATESSNRQDKYLISNMAKYYFAYNYLARLDGNRHYSGMVNYIRQTAPVNHLHYMLPVLLEDPTQLQALPDPEPIPTAYHKYLKHSDMVRIRDGDVDMSIITNNTTFFTFFKGEAALEGVRLSSAFFGKGQFAAQEMKKEGDGYVLSSTLFGPYYQPLPKEKIPAHTDAWSIVPRTERKQSEVQILRTKVYITEDEGKATIRISVDGPENLPVTLELGFRPGGTLHQVSPKHGIENAWLIHDGAYAVYRKDDDVIKVGPGVVEHRWTQLRGALPKLQAECLYFTKYAPCEFELTIE